MTAFDLAAAIAATEDGRELRVEPGEFEGPWVIERPIRLIGMGSVSVLWAHRGPVLTVRAPGTHLEALALEVTDEEDGTALLAEGPALTQQPSLAKVRVIGNVLGLRDGKNWRLPKVVDFGTVPSDGAVEKTIGLEPSSSLDVRADLAGLTWRTSRLSGGALGLHLSLDASGLTPGSLLETRMEIEVDGLIALVRLTGRIGRRELRHVARGGSRAIDLLRGDVGSVGAPGPSSPSTGGSPNEDTWAQSLVQAARDAHSQGEPDKAVELLIQAVRISPDDPEAHVLLATVYEVRGEVEEACKEWQRVTAVQPKHPEAPLRLARCLNQLGRFSQAIELLEETMRGDGRAENPDLLRALATSYYKVDRFDEALWALDRAQELAFDAKLAALRLAWERQAIAKAGQP